MAHRFRVQTFFDPKKLRPVSESPSSIRSDDVVEIFNELNVGKADRRIIHVRLELIDLGLWNPANQSLTETNQDALLEDRSTMDSSDYPIHRLGTFVGRVKVHQRKHRATEQVLVSDGRLFGLMLESPHGTVCDIPAFVVGHRFYFG
jgi:hypothetical protein